MPYDAVEDGGPDFIEMPGRTVAQAMAEILVDKGCTAEAVESAGDHGWSFWFKFRSAKVCCEVTAIDGIVATFHGPDGYKPLLRNAVPPNPDYVEILDRFGEAVDADPRFRDLGWFNPEELTGQQMGARTSTGEYDASPCIRTFGPDASDEQTFKPAFGAQSPSVSRPSDVAPGVWTPAGPLRRFAARMFDHFVIVGGALCLAVTYLRIPPRTLLAMTFDFNLYILCFSLAVGGGLLNALFVRCLATTPGKWLCRVRVVQAEGQTLTGDAALKREAEAIVMGCAMFLPLMFVAFALNFLRLIFSGDTAWDRRRGALVLQAPTSVRARAATAFCLLSSYGMTWLLALVWNPQRAAGWSL
jgi:uncharacterized RDD family membrane protein YckC